MLDRLAGSESRHAEPVEPLPSLWREQFESLRGQLLHSMEQRDWLAKALERTSTELQEQLVELDALRRARSSAESTNLIRGEILATVSRTMRTPADALLGITRLLQGGSLPGTQRAYVDALAGAAQVLRRILNDVSDFSRLESGTLPLEPIPFDLGVMLEDLVSGLAGEALTKGIQLDLIIAPKMPRRVIGDPGRLRQVLTALLRDAISRLDHGRISLQAEADSGRRELGGVRLVVEDTGPGIAPDLLPTLFEPFVRGDAYSNRDGGLALPIARQLAHLMGGDLTVAPRSDAGTCFAIRLPLARWEDASGDAALQTPVLESPSRALPGTLLVVEADPSQRTIWAAIAEASGYRAAGLNNPGEVLPELIRRTEAGNPVSIVVFSDYGAEEYAELGRQIVAREAFGKPALIMLPAVGNPGDARRLMEAGFRGYLVKPVAPADLREALETLRRTPRGLWHRLFLTRHSLAESRQAPKGSSSEGDVRVNSSAPPSVMCMSSSSRIPNSPGM